MKKLSQKISEKPITSMLVVSLISIVLAVVVIFSTNLKNSFTSNGIYAVKGLKSIELKGDGELPLYENAIGSLDKIPSGKILVIQAGFGTYIPETDFEDLVYHNGVYAGDFYAVDVNLAERKNGVLWYDSLHGSKHCIAKSNKLSLPVRERLAVEATEFVNEKFTN